VAARPRAYVLDSFALLAYLQGEAGMPKVRAVLEEAETGRLPAYMSLINLGEVLYITEREHGLEQAHRTLAAVEQSPLQIVAVERTTVLAAAHIKARFPVSYADAFAVVTAQDHGGVILTGDPEFQSIADAAIVGVEWLPRG
jgi:predicted nucleic acid-binding protein